MKKLSLLLFVCCLGLPFIYLAALSLTDQWIFPELLPSRFNFSNWNAVFNGSGGFGKSFALSVILSASVAFTVAATGFLLGRVVAYHSNGIRLQVIAYLPYAFSPVIYAYCLQYYFLKASLSGTVPGVWLAQVLLFLPLNVVFFSSHWDQRMHAFEQLSQTLGGHVFDTWKRVLIPLSATALVLSFFQSFLLSWFDYGLTTVIGLGAVPTLTVKVWQYIGEANPYLAATGSSILLFIPAFLFLFFYRRWKNSGWVRELE